MINLLKIICCIHLSDNYGKCILHNVTTEIIPFKKNFKHASLNQLSVVLSIQQVMLAQFSNIQYEISSDIKKHVYKIFC